MEQSEHICSEMRAVTDGSVIGHIMGKAGKKGRVPFGKEFYSFSGH